MTDNMKRSSEAFAHFGSPAGAPSAAPGAAADPAHEARLQQLLSPGVQAVQLLHGAWKDEKKTSPFVSATETFQWPLK